MVKKKVLIKKMIEKTRKKTNIHNKLRRKCTCTVLSWQTLGAGSFSHWWKTQNWQEGEEEEEEEGRPESWHKGRLRPRVER